MARVLSIAALGASIAALASQSRYRALLAKWIGVNAPGGIWRLLAILFALMNLKNLPFVWHLRFFKAYWYQIYLQPTPIPPHALFQPIITRTHAPLLEIDFNMHKSNSTYFADMDISRTHLFSALVRNGILKVARGGFSMPSASNKARGASAMTAGLGATDGTGAGGARGGGAHMIALGGVMCNFKKEILPYQKFEMWTRLLSWDRKWFYLVTHLVKPGVGKPSGFSLQPWRKSARGEEDVDGEALKGAVFATALARYVVKRGRLTVPPEEALFNADMVPAKPEGWVYKGDDEEGGEMNGSVDVEGVLPEKGAVEWNWDVIERERRRGLRFAEAYAELDGLHEVWDGGKEGALGEYADLLWR